MKSSLTTQWMMVDIRELIDDGQYTRTQSTRGNGDQYTRTRSICGIHDGQYTRTKSQPVRLEPPNGVDQPPFGMIVSLACRSEAFQMDGVTRVLNHNTLPSFWATLIGDSPSTIATVVSQHQYITCETHTIREGFVRHYERWHCETL